MTSSALSVIIPMRNARDVIGATLEAFARAEDVEFDVVVVDDASTDDSVAVVEALGLPRVEVVRVREHRGAGAARNLGFVHARSKYTMFFDADDEVDVSAVGEALRAMDATGADLAFLPYRYRRGGSAAFEGMNNYDREVWTRVAAGRGRAASQFGSAITLDTRPRLLGFSAYPWNKILRTDHYRRVGLRFSETIVHNDILGHWMALLEARSLVLIDRAVGTHIVADGADNLTNRRSSIRLALFDALDETYTYLASRPALRNRYSHHYWDFVMRVSDWARDRIDLEHMDEFNSRLQHHLLQINLIDFARMRELRNPRLAGRIIRGAKV